MAIYDTMQYIKSDVSTICVGMAASMGSFLLAAGKPISEIERDMERDYFLSAEEAMSYRIIDKILIK